jgi:hypothetical protein
LLIQPAQQDFRDSIRRSRNPATVEAYNINQDRQVGGGSCDPDFADCRAVIWDHGVYPTDLNDFKGGYSARLEIAKDINNVGEITGRAIDSNLVRTTFLAVPVP